MTKIDFYITDITDPIELMTFACRLTEKAVLKKHDVFIHTSNEQSMTKMDQLLWSFRPNSFLPHDIEDGGSSNSTTPESTVAQTEPNSSHNTASASAILIGHSGNPGTHHDVLVNLTTETPAFFSRFSRLAEIVQGDPVGKEKSRERFRFYRDRGYPLQVHNL